MSSERLLVIIDTEAYALGAQIVFWPSAMQTPDRDMISLARLFRYHIVGNGYPGDILNGMGRQVSEKRRFPSVSLMYEKR